VVRQRRQQFHRADQYRRYSGNQELHPNLGQGGSRGDHNSENLSGATAVVFNGTPSDITSDTATMIVTSVPTGATTGRTTVPAGIASSKGLFTVP
jgi:hypothetical protein